MAKRISAFSLVSILHGFTQIIGWLAGTVLAAVFIAVLWLTASESGARWAVAQAESFVPELSVGSVSGSLWGGLVLKEIAYEDPQPDGLKAEVGLAELGLAWWPFWRAEIRLEPVTLLEANIRLPAGAEEEPTPPSTDDPLAVFEQNWQLPVRVSLPSVIGSDIAVQAGDERIMVKHLHFAAYVAGKDATLDLHRLDVETDADDARLFAEGALALGLDVPHQLDAELEFMATVDGHWLDGRLAVSGALPEVSLTPEININAVNMPPVYLHGQVQAGPERVVLDRLTLNLLGGMFCTGGEIHFADGVYGQFDINAVALDPGWYDPHLAGGLDFALDGQFDLRPEHPEASIRLAQFEGSIAGERIERLSGRFELAENQLSADLNAGVAEGRFDLNAQAGLDAGSAFSVALLAKQAQLAPFVLPVLLGIDELTPLLAERPQDLSVALNADLNISGIMPDLAEPLTELPSADLHLAGLTLDITGLADSIEPFALTTGFEIQSGSEHLSIQGLFLDLPGMRLDADIQAEVGTLLAELQGMENNRDETTPAWQQTPVEVALALSIPEISALPWAMITPFAPPLTDFATPAGTLDFALSLSGNALAPQGEGQLSLHGFKGFDARVARMNLDFQAEDIDQAKIDLNLSGIDYQTERYLDQARLHLAGSLEELSAELTAASPFADAELALNGGLTENRFAGQLTRLRVAVPDIAELETTTTARFAADPETQRIDDFCISPRKLGPQQTPTSPDVGTLCVSGEHRGGVVDARSQADFLLADLLKFADLADLEQIQAPGRVGFEASLALDADGVPDASLQLRMPSNVVRFVDDRFPTLNYQDINVSARLQDQHVSAEADGGLTGYLGFTANGDYQLDSEQFSGAFQLQGVDSDTVSLAALVDLIEQITGTALGPVDAVEGGLQARVSARGTVDQPQFNGRILVDDLAFDSLETGTAYHDGRILLTVDDAGDVILDGGLSGRAQTPDVPVFEANRVRTRASEPTEGRLVLSGFGSIAELPDWYFDLTVSGTAIPVLRLPALALDARPDLRINARADGADVRGALHVPLAIAQVADLPQTAVTSSSDLVIEGKEQPEPTAPYAVTGDVDLILGDEISLRGLGFASRVAGELEVILRPDDPLSLVGEISLVDGRYSALGQTLQVETGRLIFAGPPGDPGLDVSAIRQLQDAQNTVAGLKITGSLNEPVTEVFSRPPTSQSDALSMLLTGRRLGQGGSSAEGALLMNAITGLGLRGGDTLAQQVGSAFGFDEFGIDTDNGLAGARLSVGRQITDDLLVRYAVGVFDGVGELITRYRINQALSIEVINSPEAQGGDVIYQFDRE